MKLSEIKTLLENKITSLEAQKKTFTEVGNIEGVIAMEIEIEENKLTLSELV